MGITNSPGYNRHYRELDIIMDNPKPIAEITMHDYVPDYQAQGECRICGHVDPKPWHRYTKYRCMNDGFVGMVIGEYKTLEGEPGVVLQMEGTKVCHLYRLKWLTPE